MAVPTLPYVVTFASRPAFDERAAFFAAVGGVETSAVAALNMATVDVPIVGAADRLVVIRASSLVARVESDGERSVEATPSDPRYAEQWALPQIGWPVVLDEPPAGTAVIAILDTGVDATHPELIGQLLPGASFVEGSASDADPNGHGTWMAGIVAATANDETGIAGAGLNALRVMPVTVIGADGSGRDSDIISGIVYATDNGADVILMSFSSTTYSVALQRAVDYAWDHDVVVVAAVGNDGSSSAAYPAGDAGVVGVSATAPEDAVWGPSNSGPAVFIGAPGAGILTTAAHGDYTLINGTSAAAAYTAAAAGLLRAKDETLTNGAIVGRLARTAAPAGTAAQTGNGRLDLGRAWLDESRDPVRPVGAHAAGGGPFVGPYLPPDVPPDDPIYTVAAAGFRSSSQNSVLGGVTSLVITKPAGTIAGDTLVAAIAFRPNTATINTPAGWTLIRRTDNTNLNTNSVATYYKIAVAGEAASYTWTLGGAPIGAAGGIVAFTNVSSCAPVDIQTSALTASALTHAAPTVTTTQAGDMLLTTHSFSSSSTWLPPAGMTEVVDEASEVVPNTAGVGLEMNYVLLGAAGATGAKTATASNDADAGIGSTIALRQSCTKTWDGGAATANWGDAANWSPDGVPTASDDVSLTGANTINVNVAAAANDLTLNNASLVLTVNSGQSLTVDGNLALTAGTLNTLASFPSVTGTTTIGAATTVGYTAASGSQTVAVKSYGNLVISGGGTKTLAGTITPAGDLTISAGTFDLSTFGANRSSAGGTLTVANGATLKIGGTGTLPSNYSTHSIGATSTVEYAGTTTAVAALNSSQSYGNLVVSGTGVTTAASFAVVTALTVNSGATFTPAAASVISGAGTLSGSGTVKVTRTAATADFSSQYTITNKTLTSLTVEYVGAGAQTVSALTYGSLKINNASGATLAGGTTVNATLTLTSGQITTGASTLVMGASGTVSRTSGHIVGKLQKSVATGSPTVSFEIGDATAYTPVSLTFASVSAGGTLVASTAAGDHAQIATSVLNAAQSVNRAWTLTGTGIVFTTYSVTSTFVAGDIDAGAVTSEFIASRYSGSWTTTSTGTRTATSTQTTGVTGFGDIAVGEANRGVFTSNGDIGGPTLAGYSWYSGGSYTVAGSGADIWAAADQFQYIYRQMSGDIRIVARVVSITNTDPWAKAGVMIRESTAAGSINSYSMMSMSNGMSHQWRTTTAGVTTSSTQAGLAAPYWVRLTRSGNVLTAERSPDGNTWTQQGSPQTVTMVASVTVGLAVTSHTNSALNVAVFDNVSVTSAPTAVGDIYAAQPSIPYVVSAAEGVLANDTDPENDTLTASLVTTTANGTLSLGSNGSFTYTPTTGFIGTDWFTYRAFDGLMYSTTATASLYVIGSIGFQAEDYVSGSATGAGWTTANEASALGGKSIISNGNNVNAAGPPPERVQYSVYFPNAGATNTYYLYVRYRLQADTVDDDSGWALRPLDANPTVGANWDLVNNLTVHGDTTYRWVDLANNASGIDGVPSYTNISAGLHTFWFGSRENGLYADAFVFSTFANLEGSAGGVTLLDEAVNDRPTAVADSYSVNEDGSLTVPTGTGVLVNDTDPEADTLTASLGTNVTNGALTLNSNGSFTYTPSGNFNGTDSFTYYANDKMVPSATAATVTITVNSVNDVPSFTKGANQAVNEDAGAQTVAAWATALSAGPSNESTQVVDFIVSNNNNGLFSVQPAVSATGTLTYTPAANASGSATVTVQIHDNGGTANSGVDTSAAQTFTITSNAVNDGPINTVPGAQSTAVNVALVFSSAGGNLISIADVDAASTAVRVTLTATNGTITLAGTTGLAFTVGDGVADATMTFTGTVTAINTALAGLTFSPTNQFAGTASLQIVTNDLGATGTGGALSDTDSVSISVVNTAPTGVADSYATTQGNALIVNAPGVLGNDTDPNVAQTLTVQSPRPVSGPSNGSLTLNADGSFTYTPSGTFTGTDSFTYKVTDGLVDSAVTTVNIAVNTTAYVAGSAWSSSFAASRYLDFSYPAYLPSGATVQGGTFNHSYRSYAGGTTCIYVEVWSGGSLIGSHGSSGAPLSCNAGTSYTTDVVSLPEVSTAARANALTIRLFVRNSGGGKSEHSLATLGVNYSLQ
jgi:VCBS repeat-containing protein